MIRGPCRYLIFCFCCWRYRPPRSSYLVLARDAANLPLSVARQELRLLASIEADRIDVSDRTGEKVGFITEGRLDSGQVSPSFRRRSRRPCRDVPAGPLCVFPRRRPPMRTGTRAPLSGTAAV